MEENNRKRKIKIVYIIIPVLIIISVLELILLIRPNKELSKQTSANYNDSISLGDNTILFDSNNVNYDNTTSGLSSSTVQDAIDELYDATNACTTALATCQEQLLSHVCSNSPFKLGDYIDMTPTSTSYSINNSLTNATAMTINPSYLNLWRVIKINKDCTVEVVSEYVLQGIDFKGKIGYKNYIYVLNETAKQFANTTYTLTPNAGSTPKKAFRIVGYDGQTEMLLDESKLIQSTPAPWLDSTSNTSIDENIGHGDTLYQNDLELLTTAGVSLKAYEKNSVVTSSYTAYLLSSRLYGYENSNSWIYMVRTINPSGSLYFTRLLIYNEGFTENRGGGALRPIVTLKSGLTISSGNGSENSHYVLSAS